MQADETASAYLKRIISSDRTTKNAEYKKFVETMKEKATPTIKTTDEMCEQASKYHENYFSANDSIIENYVGGGFDLQTLSKEQQSVILEGLPKFALPASEKGNCLSRYINVSEGRMDNFIKQFEKEGSVYEFEEFASCAKSIQGAERRFRDNNPEMNVKFVIHPKGEHPIYEAHDIGIGKYGAEEVLYKPGAKFKYLGKIKHEANPEIDNQLLTVAGEFKGNPLEYQGFKRWEIHLQEM